MLEDPKLSEYEPYSLRQMRALQSSEPVVYGFHPISKEMKTQAYYALEKLLGPRWVSGSQNLNWSTLEKIVLEEHGLLTFPVRATTSHERLGWYLIEKASTERALDVIEIGFRQGQAIASKYSYQAQPDKGFARVNDAVSLLNRRFHQHDLGYQFVGMPGVIIREDSQYIQSEVVEPTISLLHAAEFIGPLQEFLKAHQEYRRGENKDAINDALKSFESTLKAICDARGWHREQTWTAVQLIRAVLDNGLVPTSLESYFGGARSILESGVPTLRNKQSGHGQGPSVVNVPDYLAAFALHLTAANIVFLMSAHLAQQ